MVDGVSLIALGIGYLVFVKAAKEIGNVKVVGKGIAVLIMLVSLLTLLCNSMTCIAKKGCPFSGKGSCSMMGGHR